MRQYAFTFTAVVNITIGQKAVSYARASIPIMPPSSVPAKFGIYRYKIVVARRPLYKFIYNVLISLTTHLAVW